MQKERLLNHENAERILEEGWHLFQQKGYRGVTIDELCLRCQLSKPTLYYYFEDKEDLFVSVLQHKLRGFHAAVRQSDVLKEQLNSIAMIILDSFKTEYSALLRDREHIKKAENLKKIRDAFHNELFGPLIKTIQAGIDRKELRAENAELLTLVFLGMINNLIGKSSEMNVENKILAEKITTYFLEGVKNNLP